MDKLSDKKALLDSIRLSEGPSFKCDEESIFREFRQYKENDISLSMRLFSIFGGLLASLTLLGFLGLTGLYGSEIGLIFFGIGFIVAAVWLNKECNRLIIDTFSVSIYVVGFACFRAVRNEC